jgi:hypothetical protein
MRPSRISMIYCTMYFQKDISPVSSFPRGAFFNTIVTKIFMVVEESNDEDNTLFFRSYDVYWTFMATHSMRTNSESNQAGGDRDR